MDGESRWKARYCSVVMVVVAYVRMYVWVVVAVVHCMCVRMSKKVLYFPHAAVRKNRYFPPSLAYLPPKDIISASFILK